MADQVDMSVEIEAEHMAASLARAVAPIVPGTAGTCDECGHWFQRLVDGRCGFCRDGRLPPDDWEPLVPPDAITRQAPPRPTKEKTMQPKSIQLPGTAATAIAAVEQLAKTQILSLGAAAAALIDRGAAQPAEAGPGPLALGDIHLDALLEEVRRRSDLTAVESVRDAAIARAEEAEARLAGIKAALAA